MEDVWRQYALRRANFDTWCGYDREHVFAAGVRVTLDHVRESEHPERDELLQFLGETELDEEDVREWARGRRGLVPRGPGRGGPADVGVAREAGGGAGARPRGA